jgi:hypothetical protein
VKCFACGGSWSAIDLTILAHGCHYVEALRLLATETGIPWHNLTRGEHERIGIASRRARDIAVDVADWSHGLRLWAEQRKARLVDLAHEWWISGADEMGDTVAGMITTIPRAALDPESADPRLLVAAYLRATRECPKSAAEILRSGREDRAQAESITSAIIQMLARTQDRTMAA